MRACEKKLAIINKFESAVSEYYFSTRTDSGSDVGKNLMKKKRKKTSKTNVSHAFDNDKN